MARKRSRSNPGAREAIATSPGKYYQWRYKMGFARVTSQHFENTGYAKKPVWKLLKTYHLKKAEANRQIQVLDELDWKIKVVY